MEKKTFLAVVFHIFIAGAIVSSCSSDDKNETTENQEQSAEELDYSSDNANAWHNYMQQVATRLKTDADNLYDYWFASYKGGEPFSTTFTSHNSSASAQQKTVCTRYRSSTPRREISPRFSIDIPLPRWFSAVFPALPPPPPGAWPGCS